MFIHIPIPIVVKRVAAIRGAVWKLVSCTQCQQGYAYLLELEATGEDHDFVFLSGEGSEKRAQAQAAQNLIQKSRYCVLPVPCPNCGSYQEEMSRQLKEAASINPQQIAGAVILVLAAIPLMFGLASAWTLTPILGALGLTLLVFGYIRAFRFDPNGGDPEPRKALGQKYAVWDEQYAELVAATRQAQPGIPSDGDPSSGS